MRNISALFFIVVLAPQILSQQCPRNQFLFAGSCVTRCPVTHISQNDRGAKSCIECPLNRFQIPNLQGNKCQCAVQYYRDTSGVCTSCHYSCLTCRGPNQNQCSECSSDTFETHRVRKGNQCLCDEGFYERPDKLICEKCHPDCFTCSGPEDSKCNQCGSGRVKTIQGECGICGQNQIYNERNKKCECVQGAIKLKDSCVVCQQNQIWDRRLEICTCKKNEFKSSIGVCVRCPPKQMLINDTCECIANYYRDSKGKCKRCNPRVQNEECQINQHDFRKEKPLTLRDI